MDVTDARALLQELVDAFMDDAGSEANYERRLEHAMKAAQDYLAQPLPEPCAHEWREMKSDTDPYRDDECKWCGVAKAEAGQVEQHPTDESQITRGARHADAALPTLPTQLPASASARSDGANPSPHPPEEPDVPAGYWDKLTTAMRAAGQVEQPTDSHTLDYIADEYAEQPTDDTERRMSAPQADLVARLTHNADSGDSCAGVSDDMREAAAALTAQQERIAELERELEQKP